MYIVNIVGNKEFSFHFISFTTYNHNYTMHKRIIG
jgi:hypothetical protein